jgi:hypothetical protein
MSKKRRRTCRGVSGAAIIGLLSAGCASDQAAVVTPVPVGTDRWEAVMLPETTAAAFADGELEGAWWGERRDETMAVRIDGPALATSQWPGPDRPTLDRPQYLSLPTRPETIMHLRRESRWWW